MMYQILLGKPYPRDRYEQIIHELNTQDNSQETTPDERDTVDPFDPDVFIIHPYLGFTYNLTGQEKAANPFLGWPAESLSRKENKLIVAIFGGSFAEGVAVSTKKILVAELEQATGKDVILVHHAMGGYKQPQQLLALTYLLSLRAEIDMVINIDGFNEVALAPIENVPNKVYPIYPRGWFFLLGQVNSREVLTLLARLDVLEDQARDWAMFFAESRLYRSNVFLFIWWFRNTMLENERASLQLELTGLSIESDQQGYDITGPVVDFSDEKDLTHALVKVWKNSSEQMNALSQINGIRYFHFLQPNQYLKGSKPMSVEELEIAFDADHSYRHGVEVGYPLLIQAGDELRAEGINFYDMTLVFLDHPEILYFDSCCHPNSTGYEIFTKRMLEMILADGFGDE